MVDRKKYKRFQGIDLRGSNGLGSMENFKFRKGYAVLFPKETNTGYQLPSTIDFWNDPRDTYYGRLDRLGNVIKPSVIRMMPINSLREEDNTRSTRTSPMYVFDFVADAFKQFQAYMNFGPPAQKIKESPWQDVSPKKAWFNIDEKYEIYLRSNILDIYSDKHLYKYKNGFNVLNARDYVNEFFNNFIYPIVMTTPITQTAYTLSAFVGPLDTGLCIDLATEDDSEDFDKFDTWVKDPSFDYFRYEAARHGFMIDKNAPWRLVANIQSHQMRMMMKKNNVLDDYYFDVYYAKSLYQDISLLKKALFEAYNKYAEKRPIETKPKQLGCPGEIIDHTGSRRKKVDVIKRTKISVEEFLGLFDNSYWYEKYFHLRLRETGLYVQGKKFNNQLFSRHLKKISLIDKHVDMKKALEYIDNYIQKRWQPFAPMQISATADIAETTSASKVFYKPSDTETGGMSGY